MKSPINLELISENGRYFVDRAIRESGSSYAFEVSDIEDNKLFMKIGNSYQAQYIDIEYNTLTKFPNENTPNIVDIFTYKEMRCLVMEFLEGPTLSDLIKNTFIAEQAIDISLELLEILDFYHNKDIIHRDVKPQNIIVGETVKLVDWGLACYDGLKSDKIAGTLSYMSREAKLGEYYTPNDLFSVGVLLFEMVEGKKPLGRDPYKVVTGDLKEVVAKALRPIENRYLTAQEMIADLKEIR